MPRSSGLSSGRYGSGARRAVGSDVGDERPQPRSRRRDHRGAELVGRGRARTGQRRAVAGRGRSISSAPGRRASRATARRWRIAPVAVKARPCNAPTQREHERAEAWTRAPRCGPERRGATQDQRMHGEGDRPGPPAAALRTDSRARRPRGAATSARIGACPIAGQASAASRAACASSAYSAAIALDQRQPRGERSGAGRRRRSRSRRRQQPERVASRSAAARPSLRRDAASGAPAWRWTKKAAGERRGRRHQPLNR